MVRKSIKDFKLNKILNTNLETNLEDTEKQVEKIGENIFLTLSKRLYPKKKHKLTRGQRTADWISKWAGSWTFILSFIFFLAIWMFINAYLWLKYLKGDPFDPYPFILLNLVLSTLAALQAPVILMSQNRTTQRDRISAEYDYQVNKRSEKGIEEIKKQLNKIEKRFK